MLGLFSSVPRVFNVSRSLSKVNIDNGALKLQYRVTTTILIISTLIVCAQQYIGAAIECVQSSGAIAQHVLNTYCFFIGTYSVINNETAYPFHGIGPEGNHPTTRHLYYQWVPFFLFFLSIMFYSPHFLWKCYEKGKLRSMLVGMEYLHYSVCDTHIDNIPSTKEREEQLNVLARYLWRRIKTKLNSRWSIFLFLTEFYALLQVIFAYYLTDLYLGGKGAFVHLTLKTTTEVFPTMTKCLFHKYGPSGTIQKHDALCVLALNIVNEKIFYLLHFWIPFVLAVAVLAVLWRILGFFFFRNVFFNKVLIRKNNSVKLDENDKKVVLSTISYWDWIFICYMAGNSDGFVFQELFSALAECIRMDSDTDDEGGSLILKGDGKKAE